MRRLGDVLIEQGVLTADQLESAFATKPRGVMLGDWLVHQRLLSIAELGHALANNSKYLTSTLIPPTSTRKLPV